jgi:hypothetical protein
MAVTTQHPGAAKYAGINSILENNLAIYAWAAASGLRYVSIEDLSAFYVYAGEESYNAKHRVGKTMVGKGVSVEDALRRAFIALHKGLPYKQTNARKRTYAKASEQTTGKLDQWVLHNKGTMNAVQDEDGTIICTLEGLKDLTSPVLEQIRVSGVGINFQSALKNAMGILDELRPGVSPVQHVQISTS